MGMPLTYFVIYRGAFDGDKARDLEGELSPHVPNGFVQAVVAGLLAKLWHRAADQGEDSGAVGAMPARRLARVLGWPGDPEVLVQALLVTEWIEVGPEGEGYKPHDWADNQPGIADRIKKREYQRQKRSVSAEQLPLTEPVPEHASLTEVVPPISNRERDRERDRDLDLVDDDPPQAPDGPADDLEARVCALEWPAKREKGAKHDPPPWRASPPQVRRWAALLRQKCAEHPAKPHVDALTVLLEAHSWAHDNTARRPTRKGYARFVGAWVKRAPDMAAKRATGGGSRPAQAPQPARGPDPWPDVLKACQRTDRNQAVELPDKRHQAALRAIGGSRRIREAQARDLPGIRSEFYEALRKPQADPRRARAGSAPPVAGGAEVIRLAIGARG